MGKKDLYRLKDRSTIFKDPDSDFVISGDQQKPLPKKVGSVLAARVRTGALIKADEPPEDTARRVPTGSEETQAETQASEQVPKPEEKPAGDDTPRLPAAGTPLDRGEEKPAGKSGKKPAGKSGKKSGKGK